jgi:RNA polymerase sigma factor (sigma-70 family)
VILRSERGHLDPAVPIPSDERLLQEFLDSPPEVSETAFRALVTRHGPMVMGVCRHVLNHDEDAEDAFQATFWTLARKADTIRDRRLLSAWLYEVAYRIAIRARSGVVRRRDQEKQGAAMASLTEWPQQEHEAAWAELRPVLHDELNRLPEKYRLPIVLSYLEGRTNEEVASLLRWPVGTVKGRLSRARDLLRSRLVRRGLALSAAFLCSALSQGVVFAEIVPDAMVERTVGMALHGRPGGVLAARAGTDRLTTLGEFDPAEVSRIERLANSIRPPRRGPRPAWLAAGLAVALILVAFAAVLISRDPTLTERLDGSARSLLTGQHRGGCRE